MRDPLPAQRWATVNRLFEEALDLLPAHREAYVVSACAGDRQLCEEVLQLLSYDAPADTDEESELLNALQSEAASLVVQEPAEGLMLGPWRVEREIGRGGMAVVYLGSRADGAYNKQVAIKLIKRGMDTQSVVNRLRRERSILAALDHPCIARLLDGGATPDGRPYIVMDYVEGLSFAQYCERHRLGVEDRCRLLARVCDAVAYAHRNLVIHRDLKPANIMVTPDGEPKLLDFGIAKLLSDDPGEQYPEGPDTRLMRPLTPEYASPEQLRGASVGTTTDVYSLGMVAYELLTGERLSAGGEKASAVALRAGRGRRWSRQLSGDLDNILQMALRAEPERRYLSIGQFQADLYLHLKGLPVAARDETILYRCGKFLSRHRFGAVAALLVLMSLAGGIAATLWEARQAYAQRQLADRRFAQVRELAGKFLFDFHDAVSTLPGSTAVRKMVVETGIRYYDSLAKDAAGNRDLLEEIARGYDRLGDVQGNPYYSNLGNVPGAIASYNKALAVRRGISDPSPQFLADRITGNVRIAQMFQFQSKYEDSARILKEALALAPSPKPQPAVVRDAAASALSVLGDTQQRSGDYIASLPSRETVLELRRDSLKENPGSVIAQSDLASAEGKLGEYYFRLEKPEPALPHLLAAREIHKRLLAADPGNAVFSRRLRVTDMLLGNVLYGSGKYMAKPGEATTILREAERVADQSLAADPANTQALEDLAITDTSLGESLHADGDLKGARAAWEKGFAAAQRLPAGSGNDGIVSQLYRRLAIAFSDEGKLEPALENLRKAEERALATEKNAKNPTMKLVRLGDVSETRSDIYAAAKHWPEAIAELKANIADYDELARLNPADLEFVEGQPATYDKLAGIYAQAGDAGNQRKALQKALDLYAVLEKKRPLSSGEKKAREEARAKLAALPN